MEESKPEVTKVIKPLFESEPETAEPTEPTEPAVVAEEERVVVCIPPTTFLVIAFTTGLFTGIIISKVID